jgi:hypothetical protein
LPAATPVGLTITRTFCGVVVAVPIDGLVAKQEQVELLAILKADEPALMENINVAVWLVPFDEAFIVAEEGETTSACPSAVSKVPRPASIAKAAMELNLKCFRKVFKLISTGDLPGQWRLYSNSCNWLATKCY